MGEETLRTELSEEEANLYDRQIRLWGLESQKRLRSTRILVAGLNGLGAEVTKSLVLAGVKSITLLDHRNVSADDFSSQFMVQRTDIGKNRAHSSKAYAQSLNPMVEVQSEEGSLADLDEAYLGRFDMVCCAETPSTEAVVRLNAACRALGVKFYCGHVWGLFGYFFSDLVEHTYTQELPFFAVKKANDSDPGAAKKPKMDDGTSNLIQKTVSCVPLGRALQVRAGKAGAGLDKKTSPLFLLLHVLLRFHDEEGRAPTESDQERLLCLWDAVAKELAVEKERLSDDRLQLISRELCATCAVVGGVLAQDMIKVASCRDPPLKNFFLFDGIECCGLVENIGR